MFYAVVVGHDDFVGPAVGVYCVLLYSMLRLIQVITTKLLVLNSSTVPGVLCFDWI